MTTSVKASKKKEKIGTVLDSEILKRIKERSLKEGRTISDIIEDAVLKYNETDPVKSEIRKKAVERFCSKPFNLNISELNDLLNEDYYGV